MHQLAVDFSTECDALNELLREHGSAVFDIRTQFKQWSINDILLHLHHWNIAAALAVFEPEAFENHKQRVIAYLGTGASLIDFDRQECGHESGYELLESWRGFYTTMATRFAELDPKARAAWIGPDMSVRSSLSARLMESWAHAQAIYDVLGVERTLSDGIRHIAQIGINTFGWTFRNRQLAVPEAMPSVRLIAPSGARWEWNSDASNDVIEGAASEFCQVVTQTRHVADTALAVSGAVASQWMSMAQCFAGSPTDPPAPGTRFKV